MRFFAAGLPLLLLSGCWGASLPPPGAGQNENSTESDQTVQQTNQAVIPPAQAGQVGQVGQASQAHPMAAYLGLRPFLPVKPTFFPPFVDSSSFVDRKAALLSSLFGVPPPAPEQAAAPAPAPAPAPGLGPVFPFYAPGFFAAKKNSFLNALFSGQSPYASQPYYAAAQPARRALPGAVPPPAGLGFAPGVFAAKKAAFLQKLFETLNATEAPPTPAALPSWLDLLDNDVTPGSSQAAAPLPRVPLAPAAPIDPNFYANKKTDFLNSLFDSIGLPPPTPKPTIVPASFWSPFAPQPGASPFVKPTIVPAGYWVPPGKPTPGALYKAKVAAFLGKLFQQLNATAAPGSASGITRRDVHEDKEEEEEVVESKEELFRRGLAGPFAPPFGGPLGGPFGAKPFIGGPYGVGKPFIGGPFGAGKPFGPSIDPSFFMDKKTAFLNQLIASKAAGAATDGTGAADPKPSFFGPFGPYGSFAPTPKPTIVPPDFWNPFPAGGAGATAGIPAVKPTIVPPGFWSPFGAPNAAGAGPAPAGAFFDKKTKFLNALFALKATAAPTPAPEQEEGPADDDAQFDSFLEELAEALDALATPDDAPLSKRSAATPDVARQQLIDSAVAQMAAIKNNIVSTVDEILKQKEAAAAAQPAFPFAKSPYAAYGAAKKGGPGMAGKKGGPPPGIKGGFPFWGGAAPTPDPTAPLQQRLQVLSQAFDSLAALEKDASAALQAAAANPAPAPGPVYSFAAPAPVAAAPATDTATLLQLLRAAAADAGVKPSRKTKGSKAAPRSVQFAVRQGQLSLPPGAEELLTAGGGAGLGQHEGGGLRLQIKVPAA